MGFRDGEGFLAGILDDDEFLESMMAVLVELGVL